MINGKVVDTSIWIEFLWSEKNERRILVIQLIDLNEIILLPVILQETLQGIKNDSLYQLTKKTLLSYYFIENDLLYSAVGSAELYRFLRQKGATIRKPNDCLIAATCIDNKISLFHNDKYFDNIAKYTLKIYKN